MTTSSDDDAVTLAEWIEYLRNLNASAKRQQCIIGSTESPSAWDASHRRMDEPLDDVLWLSGC